MAFGQDHHKIVDRSLLLAGRTSKDTAATLNELARIARTRNQVGRAASRHVDALVETADRDHRFGLALAKAAKILPALPAIFFERERRNLDPPRKEQLGNGVALLDRRAVRPRTRIVILAIDLRAAIAAVKQREALDLL